MIDAPPIRVHLNEDQRRWELNEDLKDARHNLLVRIVQLIWLGIVTFGIVVALRHIHAWVHIL